MNGKVLSIKRGRPEIACLRQASHSNTEGLPTQMLFPNSIHSSSLVWLIYSHKPRTMDMLDKFFVLQTWNLAFVCYPYIYSWRGKERFCYFKIWRFIFENIKHVICSVRKLQVLLSRNLKLSQVSSSFICIVWNLSKRWREWSKLID